MRNQAVIDLVYNKFEQIEDKMKQMQIDINKISSFVHVPSLENLLLVYNKNIAELVEQMKVNALRVNPMILELKGVVAMARAALDEGRKMTEMIEIPRLLNEMAGHVYRFDLLIGHLDSVTDRLICSATPQEPCEKPPTTM